MRSRTSLVFKLILANLFLRSAQCAFNDDQYSIFRNNLIAVRNELLSIGEFLSEQEIPSPSISNIEEAVSVSAIYSSLGFESIASLPLPLENTAIHDPIAASPSESVGSASAQDHNAFDEAQSNDIDAFQAVNLIAQDREITPKIASNNVAAPVAEVKSAIYPIDNDMPGAPIANIKPPASAVGVASDGTNKPISQAVSPSSNVQTVPIVNDKSIAPIINNKPTVPVINNGPAAPFINKPAVSAVPTNPVLPVINNKPVAPVQIKVPVASVVHYRPIASIVNNRPIATVVNNRPVASVVNNKPIASVVNNSPAVAVNVHKPAPSVNIVKPIASVIHQRPAPSVNIAKPIASVIHQRPSPSSVNIVKPVASGIQHVPAAAASIVHLVTNATAEKQIKPCYRNNKKVAFSQYWIPRQNEWDETNDGERVYLGSNIHRRMSDRNGVEIGWVPVEMYDKCKMEGTCILENGDLINIDNSTDSFIKVGRRGRKNNVFGLGSGSQNLVPFISIAANDLPLGQKLYIPQLDGVDLGGGMQHNGCVRVDDDSWSFDSCQLDFFVLSYVDYLWLRLDDQVSVKFQDCQLKNYINKYHLAMVKASMDEKIIPSLLDAKYVPL